MKVEEGNINGLIVITPTVFADERGFFMETYNEVQYTPLGIPPFVQDNESLSGHNVLRGLHYQLPPFSQGKLVSVSEGEVFDVAVDLRPHSATCGKYFSVVLSDKNKKQFWIPEGFAHGFLVLSERARLKYKCTAIYEKSTERSVKWDDPELNVSWKNNNPLISNKDAEAESFDVAMSEIVEKNIWHNLP